jgi:hypothetical protein
MDNRILNFLSRTRTILLVGTISSMYFIATSTRPFVIFVIIAVFLVFALALVIGATQADADSSKKKEE